MTYAVSNPVSWIDRFFSDFDRNFASGRVAPSFVPSVDVVENNDAYVLRADDDDFSQPGALVRNVFNDEQRAKLVDQVSGSLLGGVRGEVLERAFQYWKSIDPGVGGRIEARVREGRAPKPAEGMGEG